MKNFFRVLVGLLAFQAVLAKDPPTAAPVLSPGQDLTSLVNPFIGTSKMGHVFPGATAPFGMVQLSPQTNWEVMFKADGSYNRETYEYCAGYQYRDTTLIGFAHTNFSGTGHSDLGDFLVMPTTGELVLDPLQGDDGSRCGTRKQRPTSHGPSYPATPRGQARGPPPQSL